MEEINEIIREAEAVQEYRMEKYNILPEGEDIDLNADITGCGSARRVLEWLINYDLQNYCS